MEFIRDSNLKRNRINAFNDDDVVAPKAKIQKLQDEIEQDCLGGLGYETFFFVVIWKCQKGGFYSHISSCDLNGVFYIYIFTCIVLHVEVI